MKLNAGMNWPINLSESPIKSPIIGCRICRVRCQLNAKNRDSNSKMSEIAVHISFLIKKKYRIWVDFCKIEIFQNFEFSSPTYKTCLSRLRHFNSKRPRFWPWADHIFDHMWPRVTTLYAFIPLSTIWLTSFLLLTLRKTLTGQ